MDDRRPARAGAQNPAYRPAHPPSATLTCAGAICGTRRAFSKMAPIAASTNTAPRFTGGADGCWRQCWGTAYERSSEVPHESETEEVHHKPGQGGLAWPARPIC